MRESAEKVRESAGKRGKVHEIAGVRGRARECLESVDLGRVHIERNWGLILLVIGSN